jgi:hypothetical protein
VGQRQKASSQQRQGKGDGMDAPTDGRSKVEIAFTLLETTLSLEELITVGRTLYALGVARRRQNKEAIEEWATRVYARIIVEMGYPDRAAFDATKKGRGGNPLAAQTRGLGIVILHRAGVQKNVIGRVLGYTNADKSGYQPVYRHLSTYGHRDTDAASLAMVQTALVRAGLLTRTGKRPRAQSR